MSYQPVLDTDVDWLVHYLDQETVITEKEEEKEGIEGHSLVDSIRGATKVVVGGPPTEIPIAVFGIKDGRAWMMTTRFLHDYRLHRTLIEAMRDVLGKHIRENGPLRGHVRTTSGIPRMLARLGATFTLPCEVPSGRMLSQKFLLWSLDSNSGLLGAA